MLLASDSASNPPFLIFASLSLTSMRYLFFFAGSVALATSVGSGVGGATSVGSGAGGAISYGGTFSLSSLALASGLVGASEKEHWTSKKPSLTS